MFSSVPGGAYKSPFGPPRQLAPPRTLTLKVKKKASKKKKKKKVYSSRPFQQRRWDPISGGYR